MAQKHNTINNHKGQALIETTGILVISGVFLYLLLKSLLAVIFSVALDSMAEDYFFCELARKPSCEQLLYSRLRDNQMKDIKINTRKLNQNIILTVTATHLVSMTVTREFDYEKFRPQL